MDTIETLRELGGVEDPGLLTELIDLFLADAPARIEEIQSALECEDFDLLERASHTLKSASANLGATRLSKVCADLERAAREKEISDSAAKSAQSQQCFQDVERALIALKS